MLFRKTIYYEKRIGLCWKIEKQKKMKTNKVIYYDEKINKYVKQNKNKEMTRNSRKKYILFTKFIYSEKHSG